MRFLGPCGQLRLPCAGLCSSPLDRSCDRDEHRDDRERASSARADFRAAARHTGTPPDHAENRRVLTGPQTRHLVRYATALHACLTRSGADVAAPKKTSRAITLESARAVGVERLAAA